MVGRGRGEVRKFSSHLDTVPHLQIPDRTIEVVARASSCSADDVVGAGQDVWLPSVSLGAAEDTVPVHLQGGILDGYHHMGPCGRVEVARVEVLRR